VWAKLLINAVRILKKQGLTTPLQNVVTRRATTTPTSTNTA
jgi:hypothetical protein